MVVNHNDYAFLVISPNSSITRRQDAPEVFDMTTVAYVISTNFVKKHNGIFEGKVKSVIVPRERAVDIDDLMDFKIVELFLKNSQFVFKMQTLHSGLLGLQIIAPNSINASAKSPFLFV
mgnify:CR=1 FL=1